VSTYWPFLEIQLGILYFLQYPELCVLGRKNGGMFIQFLFICAYNEIKIVCLVIIYLRDDSCCPYVETTDF